MSPTPELLLQMVQQNADAAEADHRRLRETCHELEGWLNRHDREIADNTAALAAIKATPIEATQIRFSPSVVLSIVTVCAAIFGGIWASTYDLRSDVRNILTRQQDAIVLQDERSKLSDSRAETLQRQQDAMQQKLHDLEQAIDKLTKAVR